MPASANLRVTHQKALLLLLRPLARFCIRYGFRIQDILEVMKAALVESAERHLDDTQVKVNTSRISILTGLQRKDIVRIQESELHEARPDKTIPGRVIGQWEQNPRFQTKEGKPAVLDYETPESRFHDLVRTITTNLNPATVLFELERMGAVTRTPRGLKLAQDFSSLSNDLLGAIDVASQDFQTLLTCVEENTQPGPKVGNLHIRTEYDNIYLKHADEIRLWIIEKGKEFHRSAREYLSKFDKDVYPSSEVNDPAGLRVTLQAFSLITLPAVEVNDSQEERQQDLQHDLASQEVSSSKRRAEGST